MATSSRSSQAVLLLMVAVVLLVATAPTMVDAWCPMAGDSCGPAYPCCRCDGKAGPLGHLLYCGFQWDKGFVCLPDENICGFGTQCGGEGNCYPWNSLEGRVREALALPLPRKLSMKKE
jgi:hypothetical protein